MSAKGVLIVAGVLTRMQNARQELLDMAAKSPGSPIGKQDARLAQLLEEAKDLMQDRFNRETLAVDDGK